MIYETLIQGPSFSMPTTPLIRRDALVNEVTQLITPGEESLGYSLIVNWVARDWQNQFALNGLKIPQGIAYLPVFPNSNVSALLKVLEVFSRAALNIVTLTERFLSW
jgi:hypothetical protein